MDTKWKDLNHNPSMNYGISQADMYQMYAYAKKYKTGDVWLLYPVNDSVRDMHPISFEAVNDESKRVSVKIFFIDLANYDDSLNLLYQRVFKE